MTKAKNIDDLLKQNEEISQEEVRDLFMNSWNTSSKIGDHRYYKYTSKSPTYGMFFPFSFMCNLRGRFDSNSFNYYPQTLHELIIQSNFIHEYAHLIHFSGTPAGIIYSINLANILLDLFSIIPKYYEEFASIDMPLINHLSQSHGSEIQEFTATYKDKFIRFSPMHNLSNEEVSEEVLYPEDILELGAVFNQISLLSSRVSGNDVLEKINKWMANNNLALFSCNSKVSRLISEFGDNDIFNLIPIIIDLALFGDYQDLIKKNYIIDSFLYYFRKATKKYRGLDFPQVSKKGDNIWDDLYEGKNKRDIYRNTTHFFQEWRKALSDLPVSFFDTMSRSLTARNVDFNKFLYPFSSFFILRKFVDFPMLINPEMLHTIHGHEESYECSGMIIPTFPLWVHGKDILRIIEWSEIAFITYQISFCKGHLVCPDQGLFSNCANEPLSDSNSKPHACSLENILLNKFKIDKTVIKYN
jgi:hypothetical protein